MPDDETNPIEVRRLRTLQLIIAAITMGAATLLAIVTFVPTGRDNANNPADRLPIVTILAVGWGVLSLPMGLMLSAVIVKAGLDRLAGRSLQSTGRDSGNSGSRKSESAEPLLRLFPSKTIVAAAMAESAVLLACVAYLMERSVYALVIAVLLLPGLVLQIPTRDRMGRWLAGRTRQIEEDRQLRGNSVSS